MTKIDVDKLSLEVIQQLQDYVNVTSEIVEQVVVEVAKETVSELRATSPEGRSGDYAKSWKCKRDNQLRGKNKLNMVVYSGKPYYRLTHLLERGHALRSGGRTVGQARAYPHIKNAEINAVEKLEYRIKQKIQEASV